MPEKTTTKTRKREITVTDETLAETREGDSPMAVMLRALPDSDAKKIIQRIENAVEKSSKGKLENDETYQTARKHYESCKNTFYRTRNKLNVDEISKLDGFQTRVASLKAKIAEIEKEREGAAALVQDDRSDVRPEGKLHENMRLAQIRKRALARKCMGLNGSETPTPEDILTDGE